MTNANGEKAVNDVIRLLDDDCARQILVETTSEPMSANELSERCDVSLPTIYRRIDELGEHELINEQTRAAPNGHHYSVYAAALDQVEIDITEDGLELDLTTRERMVDRFTIFIEDVI